MIVLSSINIRGFTLVEVVVSLGILVIVTSGASALLITSIRSNDTIWGTLTVQQEGRQVVQEIVDDVRRAEVSSIGSYPIVSASDYEFTLYANIDNDPDREQISYWIEDATLYKGVIKPTGTPLRYLPSSQVVKILATGVLNSTRGIPLFSYYNQTSVGSENEQLSPIDITQIRMVGIFLELEQPKSRTGSTLQLESIVQMRNLKEN
jgi:prepilin-type N-terminal cleavage/methylation domain-containing protein